MIEIVLVDDNPTDALMVREAIDYIGLDAKLHCLDRGEALLPHLRGDASTPARRPPQLILLDLGLPDRNGFELLGALKTDPDLRHIPVIMLTASVDPAHVQRAFELQAACYIVKPPAFERMIEAMRAVGALWGALPKEPSQREKT